MSSIETRVTNSVNVLNKLPYHVSLRLLKTIHNSYQLVCMLTHNAMRLIYHA